MRPGVLVGTAVLVAVGGTAREPGGNAQAESITASAQLVATRLKRTIGRTSKHKGYEHASVFHVVSVRGAKIPRILNLLNPGSRGEKQDCQDN